MQLHARRTASVHLEFASNIVPCHALPRCVVCFRFDCLLLMNSSWTTKQSLISRRWRYWFNTSWAHGCLMLNWGTRMVYLRHAPRKPWMQDAQAIVTILPPHKSQFLSALGWPGRWIIFIPLEMDVSHAWKFIALRTSHRGDTAWFLLKAILKMNHALSLIGVLDIG